MKIIQINFQFNIKKCLYILCALYTLINIMEFLIIPRTSTLTLRLPLELIDQINHYSEILRLKPSTLASMILQDKLDSWVKEYAEKVYKDVID